MTERQRRAIPWIVAGLYLTVVAAIVAGIAPVWCLGILFAVPLAVRLVRQAREGGDVIPQAVAFATVFTGEIILGYVIKVIVR